jgi:hypothetical protein
VSEPAIDVSPPLARALTSERASVATALTLAGYFGPFGVDAFVYRDRLGTERLQPRSEVNARYSMGFAVGLPHVPGR